MKPSFLILCGDGINCERETAKAFELAGAAARIVHINDVLETPVMLREFQGLAIPGGFSFGDELGSGQIMALKIRHKLGDAFFDFVAAGKPVIGICNGFQVLVKLGLLPFPKTLDRALALAPNLGGGFIDRWVALDVDKKSVCRWTEGLERLELPIRHGEGRIVFRDEKLYAQLQAAGQIPLSYAEDVNGSHGRIAGLCDPTGMVLGLMPHPEAHVRSATYKTPAREYMKDGDGLALFSNIVRIIEGTAQTEERKYARA